LHGILQVIPDNLADLLVQDGFILFISGGKEHGKTNTAMLIAEICFHAKIRPHIATNIGTESYFVKQITNYPDLKEWLERERGKKLFIMDELGKIMQRMGFATKTNRGLLDILQLIRHYDAGFIGIAPSTKFVDSNFLNSDLLDAHIKKIGKTVAKIKDILHGCSYFFNEIPKTSIKHNGKDIAIFNMNKQIDVEALPACCKAAKYFGQTKNLRATGKFWDPPIEATQVKRLLLQHCTHSVSNM